MQPIPVPPNPSDPLRASFGRAVVAALRERTVRAGPGLYARTGPGGTVIGLAREAVPGSSASKTDTAVAATSENAPQNRSVEVREAVAATEAGPAAGTDATPAAPAALQLYRFDEPEPDKGDGISATVTVPEKGGTCTVDFGLPAGATPGTAEIMLAARRIDPDTGARSLAWLKLGVAPGSEDGEEGGGEDGGGDGGGGDGGECSEADGEAFPSDIEGDSASGGNQGWVGKEDNWDEKPFPSDDKDGPAPEDSERFPSKIGPCW